MSSTISARDLHRGYIIGMILFALAIPVIGIIAACLSPDGQVIQGAVSAPSP